MLEQIAWMACGVDQKVDRSLYIEDSGKSAAQQREAMEAVKTGRFERAEKSLKTALQMDTKNALLYHDLGVLEERSGRPLEAASYFRAAQGKRLFQNIDGDEYTNILKNQFRDFEANQFQSTAYSVIGGYWAMFNRGQSADIKVGAVYPVYRLRQVYNNKFNVVGPQLSEVGEVSIVAVKSGYLVGKINRFMLPDGINVGDFLWFH